MFPLLDLFRGIPMSREEFERIKAFFDGMSFYMALSKLRAISRDPTEYIRSLERVAAIEGKHPETLLLEEIDMYLEMIEKILDYIPHEVREAEELRGNLIEHLSRIREYVVGGEWSRLSMEINELDRFIFRRVLPRIG